MTRRESRHRGLVALVLAAAALAASCGGGAPPPAKLDTSRDACGYCRMMVSDARMAMQIVAPLEEPRFFDDFGCLASFLKIAPLKPDTEVYVTDHRTGEWIRADHAVYSRVATFSAPMGSHVIAHASEASRRADPEAADGVAMVAADVFPGGVPGGGR